MNACGKRMARSIIENKTCCCIRVENLRIHIDHRIGQTAHPANQRLRQAKKLFREGLLNMSPHLHCLELYLLHPTLFPIQINPFGLFLSTTKFTCPSRSRCSQHLFQWMIFPDFRTNAVIKTNVSLSV